MKPVIGYVRVDEVAIANWKNDPVAFERCLDRELAATRADILRDVAKLAADPNVETPFIAHGVELA